MRETFFFNQLQAKHQVTAPKFGDFMIDETYTFEIGGKDKTTKQISGVPLSYIAADDLNSAVSAEYLYGCLFSFIEK